MTRRDVLVVGAGLGCTLALLAATTGEQPVTPENPVVEQRAVVVEQRAVVVEQRQIVETTTHIDLGIEEQRGGDEHVLRLATDVLFDFDSDELRPEAAETLDEAVQRIPTERAIVVTGHTDSVGSRSYNQDLSRRRAETVAAALLERQPDLQLEIRAAGESEPLVEEGGENDEEARARNRRVELRFADDG